ncbi:N protein [American dog tick virus]|uniref:Nucleoprotein n=1 Tax=American dog tick virus TaxID=2847048 RepID=A0A076E9Z2_9VIRU|nr:N protein [American dog tick virus]AII01800.1 N protein [American dog tick virus]
MSKKPDQPSTSHRGRGSGRGTKKAPPLAPKPKRASIGDLISRSFSSTSSSEADSPQEPEPTGQSAKEDPPTMPGRGGVGGANETDPTAPGGGGAGGAGAGGANGGAGGGAGAGVVQPNAGDVMPEGTIIELLGWALERVTPEHKCLLTNAQLKRLLQAAVPYRTDEAYVLGVAQAVEYQGFDPAMVAKRVLELAHQDRKEAEDVILDIITMVGLYLTRGTNLTKMEKRISPEGLAILRRVSQRYNLKKGAVGPNELTLSRVALTYASITVRCAVQLKDRLAVPHDEMLDLSPGYPPALMTQAFASLIPKGHVEEEVLKHAHCLFLVKFSEVVNPQLRGKPGAELKRSFTAALKASLEKRESRDNLRKIAFLKEMGVLSQEDTAVEAVRHAAAKFTNTYGPLE